jgi:hypothetical protein
MNFLKNFKISQLNCGTTDGVESGSLTSTSNPIDMSGYEGVVFVGSITQLETTDSYLSVAYSCSSGGTFHDIAGTKIVGVSSGTNVYYACEINNPLPDQRFMAATVTVTGTCDWVGAIMAIQYGADSMPVTQPTCNVTEIHISATSGTV